MWFPRPQYLSRRAADWKAAHRNSQRFRSTQSAFKFVGDDGRAAFRDWTRATGSAGIDEHIMLRELLRRVDMMVMLENRLDALVRLHPPLPPARIGGAPGSLGCGRTCVCKTVLLVPTRACPRGVDPGRICDDRV